MKNLPKISAFLLLSLFVFSTNVSAATTSVSITSSGFVPESITVEEGDIVVWTNDDTIDHEALDDLVEWETGLIAPGETGSYTFNAAGTYTYSDTVDPSLVGTILVEIASAGSGSTTTTTTTTSSSSSSSTPSQPVSGVEGPTIALLAIGAFFIVGGVFSKRLAQ